MVIFCCLALAQVDVFSMCNSQPHPLQVAKFSRLSPRARARAREIDWIKRGKERPCKASQKFALRVLILILLILSCGLKYNTYIRYLQVAITTPEGGS